MTCQTLTADSLARILSVAVPTEMHRLCRALEKIEEERAEADLRQMILRPCVLRIVDTGAIDDNGIAFNDRTIYLTVDIEGAEELSVDWCDTGDPETGVIEYILGDADDPKVALYDAEGDPATWLRENWEERATKLVQAAIAYVDVLADEDERFGPDGGTFTIEPLGDAAACATGKIAQNDIDALIARLEDVRQVTSETGGAGVTS